MTVVTSAGWAAYASADEVVELSEYKNLETVKKIEIRME